MKKYIICLFLGIAIGFIIHPIVMKDKANPWKPVLEKTSFQYLEYSVENIIKGIHEVEKDLHNKENEQSDDTLHQTMNHLLKLEYYYLPITEVRQLLYDAERLLSLNQKDNAKNNLIQASQRLARIEKLKGSIELKKTVTQLDNLIKDVILVIDESKEMAVEKLKTAAESANLMLLKGELVLSDIDYTQIR